MGREARVASMTIPIGSGRLWPTLIIVAVIGGLIVNATFEKSKRKGELEALRQDNRALIYVLSTQINHIQTAADAEVAYAAASQALIAAYRKLSHLKQEYATSNDDRLLPQIEDERNAVDEIEELRKRVGAMNPLNFATQGSVK